MSSQNLSHSEQDLLSGAEGNEQDLRLGKQIRIEQSAIADVSSGLENTSRPDGSGPYVTRALAQTKELSRLLRELAKTSAKPVKQTLAGELQVEAEKFKGICAEARWSILGTFVSALNKLLKLLKRDADQINASTLRTGLNAVDFVNAVLLNSTDLGSIERAPLRALVIDDNQTCRGALVLALSSENLRVFAASGGDEAMANLRQNDYDVVFTDIMMPKVNGFAVVKAMRALPQHARTPVIFVTALSDFDTRSRSILSGGCDLVAKPINPAEVLVKAFTFGLRGRFPEWRRKHGKSERSKTIPNVTECPHSGATPDSRCGTQSAKGSIALEQILVRFKAKLEDEYQARCTEQRELQQRIAALQKELNDLRARDTAMEQEQKGQYQLMQQLDLELKNRSGRC